MAWMMDDELDGDRRIMMADVDQMMADGFDEGRWIMESLCGMLPKSERLATSGV